LGSVASVTLGILVVAAYLALPTLTRQRQEVG
jgi:hypothetical protein